MNIQYYTIYESNTGKIFSNITSTEEDIQFNIPQNCQAIIGNFPAKTGYIENDQYVAMPPIPGDYYIIDYATKTWVQDYNWAAKTVKSERDQILYESDWTQIPNNPLTTEKQQEWATYRQQLRDVTSQPGYPYNVVWPTPPTN